MSEEMMSNREMDLPNREVKYSLIVPVYNEEESLEPLFTEVQHTMTSLGSYEIIFIDDCSSDRSVHILRDFEKKYPDVIRILTLTERSGQTKALRQGLDIAGGDFVITLDADLQNDPADIPKLLMKMAEGYHCVCGWRKSRNDKLLKAILSKLGNFVQRLFTGLKIHDISCTLRAYKRECVEMIPLNWEGQHRFIPLSLSLQGFKIGEIVSNHRKRRFGESKYTHKRIFKVMVDFLNILKRKGKE